MKWPRALVWPGHEFLEMLPAVVFFAVGFNLILTTTNLILKDYALQFGNTLLATTAALVVGKAVLVANATPFLKRYDTADGASPTHAELMLLLRRLSKG